MLFRRIRGKGGRLSCIIQKGSEKVNEKAVTLLRNVSQCESAAQSVLY